MKKRYMSIFAIAVVAVILCTVFMGCTQSEEDYYNDIAEDVAKFNEKYDDILANLNKANFSVTFSFNTHYNAALTRGSSDSKGWDSFENAYNDFYDSIGKQDPNIFDNIFGTKTDAQKAIDDLGVQTNAWMDSYTEVTYMQNGSKNFYLKIVTYPSIWENYYDSFTEALEDPSVLSAGFSGDSDKIMWQTVDETIKNKSEYVLKVENGVYNGVEYDGIEELSSIVGIVTGEMPVDDCYTFTNGNKIYTHVMQAQYITAYKPGVQGDVSFGEIAAPEYGTEEWKEFLASFPETIKSWNLKAEEIFRNNLLGMSEDLRVGRSENVDGKYWSGFGEDIVYNWENLGALKITRYTYNYSKSKSRLDQIDFYTEYIKPYYTEKSAADTTLELKGDVYYNSHIVADFVYSDSAITFPQ